MEEQDHLIQFQVHQFFMLEAEEVEQEQLPQLQQDQVDQAVVDLDQDQEQEVPAAQV
jgi:hypothetical protein